MKATLGRTMAAALLLMLVAAPGSWACAVCGGDPAAPISRGLFMGVLVLLGMVAAVLVAFAWFFMRIARRSRLAVP